MKRLIFFSCLAFLVSQEVFAKKSYAGYKVYKVQFENDDQAKLIQDLEKAGLIDLFQLRRAGSGEFMVSPDEIHRLEVLTNSGIGLEVLIENYQAVIDRAEELNERALARQDDWWNSYHNITEIERKVKEIVDGSSIASLQPIGKSELQRDMNVVMVCKDTCGTKPAMFIQSGIHAREWVAPAATTWMLNELLTTDISFTDNLDWYFVNIVNPDGYEYTWNGDRMWRKTRSTNGGNFCLGADANRNYQYCWNTGGSSDNSCTDTYHGPTAESEVEIENINRFIAARVSLDNTGIKFFNDVHSYSQLVLLPYGCDAPDPCGNDAPNHDERSAAANKWNVALKNTHGMDYRVGNIPTILYPASGGSLDYMLGVLGIKYSIAMELRPESGTSGGFELPPDQIIPTAEEVWAFHKAAAADMVAEYPIS